MTKQKYLHIGQECKEQGGVYAGIVRGRDGAPDYHLFVGPDLGEKEWQQALADAKKVNVGDKKDFTLPYRAEQAVMFGNVPELFEKQWHWSQEQSADLSDWAWAQNFTNGLQLALLKGHDSRARAVRRVPIE